MPLPGMIEAEWRRFRETRTATVALVQGLTQEQFDWRPAASKWSVGEVVDHLLLSEQFWQGEFARLIALAQAGQRPIIERTLVELNVAPFLIPRPLLPLFAFPFQVSTMLMPKGVFDWLIKNRFLPMRNPDMNEPRRGQLAGELRTRMGSISNHTKALFEANPSLDYRAMTHRHPALGTNDVPAILTILASHEQRHQMQIRDALRTPGFPRVSREH